MAILDRLNKIYPNQADHVYQELMIRIESWKNRIHASYRPIDERDVCLITYGDSIRKDGEKPLATMLDFYIKHLKEVISTIHILPFYPYTSDDGFSVVDFRKIDPNLGDWEDIKVLHQHVDLMFDAVINHVSKESEYFKKFLKQEKPYENFFFACDPKTDLSSVTRPRTSPVLTPFETIEGIKHVWTTFSDDQIDLNYAEPKVLLEVIDVLLFYIEKGARMIRFDAVGFIWKVIGTTCMHLEQTHEIVKLMREVIDMVSSEVKVITETNVKHPENISYFGNGNDEASLVYQFPLPPLVAQAYISEKSTYITNWLSNLEETSDNTMFFNFLSSHDGIGLRPLEGLMDEHDKKEMIDVLLKRGAKINYRMLSDGSKTPYECCITYTDALSDLSDSDTLRSQRTLGAHMILLSLQGLPAIYIHSLLGSRNDEKGYHESKINRRINREKLSVALVKEELADENHLRHLVFSGMKKMIKARKNEPLFHPSVPQRVLKGDERIFQMIRGKDDNHLLVLINVSRDTVKVEVNGRYQNLLTGDMDNKYITLKAYEYGWYKTKR